MLIRPLAVTDMEDAASLCTQLGYPCSAADVRRRFALLAGDPEHALYVAESPEGRAIGMIHVCGRRFLEADPYAEIGGLVVDANWRGRRVGEALVAEAEAWARSRGYTMMRVRSNSIREAAHRFYRRLGYQLVKTQHVFSKPLHGSAPSPAAP